MSPLTSTLCRDCGHLHDDWCDAAVIDTDGAHFTCGCEPPCDVCGGSGDGRSFRTASGYEHHECDHCGGTGKEPEPIRSGAQ